MQNSMEAFVFDFYTVQYVPYINIKQYLSRLCLGGGGGGSEMLFHNKCHV